MTDNEKLRTELQRLDLNGEWRFRLKNRNGVESQITENLDQWMQAEVPGTVHTDLMTLDKIPDPFFGDNEYKVQWVGEADWEYARSFHITQDCLEQQNIDLVCEGLDTLATIFINDQEIAQCRNMFITHRFPIKNYLKPGENEICIRFDSPLVCTRELEQLHGKLTEIRHSHRMYLRKAQYSFGWDWGPMLPTSGIWRPIYLEGYNSIRIADVSVKTFSCTSNVAKLEIEAVLEGEIEKEIICNVKLAGGGETVSQEVISTENRVRFFLSVANPKLWWPGGWGDPYLYDFRFTVSCQGVLIDEKRFKYGIRTTELRLTDEKGENCFHILVNGKPVFCRGADWIPADSFIPRVTPEKYRRLLEMSRDAGMNMLRIWGGGIYENPIFYQLCDEMGIMVWQDFMFACGAYPESDDFLQQVKEESEWVVKELRNHSSIVIWCGNNENEWIYYHDGSRLPQKMSGFKIFHDMLPELCENLDQTRPYWPSTPWGGDDPNSEDIGNRHSWDIWSRWVDFTEVVNDHGKFISEFGFQAPASVETMNSCLKPEDRNPEGEVFADHQKQEEGNERLFRFLAGHQKVTTEYIPFIYACQVNQAEALKTCIEHWRSRKFDTAGALIWQLNDCWPVSSWSLIDSRLEPKASYFYSKKFFHPILMGFEEAENNLVLYIVNDTPENLQGEVHLNIRTFFGEEKLEKKVAVNVPDNGLIKIPVFCNEEMDNLDKKRNYVKASLKIDGQERLRSNNIFLRYKWMDFPEGSIQAEIINNSSEGVKIQCKSKSFLKSVYLHLPGWSFSDNFFDLDADNPVELAGIKTDASAPEINELIFYSVGYYTPRAVSWNSRG